VWNEVVEVYIIALKAIWWFGLAVSILGLLVVGLERRLELSSELTTEYGLDNERQDSLTPDAGGQQDTLEPPLK
jgi:hypothetical protein